MFHPRAYPCISGAILNQRYDSRNCYNEPFILFIELGTNITFRKYEILSVLLNISRCIGEVKVSSQLLNNVIINETKVLLPQAYM